MDPTVPAARELGVFLRSRREQTTPADLGLEPGARRKVEGLRREEVAALAGLSTDYYQRLEQGRNVRPSDAVLDSLADALDLSDVERRHLLLLARAARTPTPRPRRAPERVPAHARALLDATALPALVINQFLDVLAWNYLAQEVLGDPENSPAEERNLLFATFEDENACVSDSDGEAAARGYIGMLRAAVAADPEHPRAVAVVGGLSVRSAAFRRLWARNEVRDGIRGTHTARHPRVGSIDLHWNSYSVHGTAGLSLLVFTPRAGHEDSLRMVASAPAHIRSSSDHRRVVTGAPD